MEVNIQEKIEFYARLTIKKLEEMDVTRRNGRTGRFMESISCGQ